MGKVFFGTVSQYSTMLASIRQELSLGPTKGDKPLPKGKEISPLFFGLLPIGSENLLDWVLVLGSITLLLLLGIIIALSFLEIATRRRTRMALIERISIERPREDRSNVQDEGVRPLPLVEQHRFTEISTRLDVLQAELETNTIFLKGIAYGMIISAIVLLFVVIRTFS